MVYITNTVCGLCRQYCENLPFSSLSYMHFLEFDLSDIVILRKQSRRATLLSASSFLMNPSSEYSVPFTAEGCISPFCSSQGTLNPSQNYFLTTIWRFLIVRICREMQNILNQCKSMIALCL